MSRRRRKKLEKKPLIIGASVVAVVVIAVVMALLLPAIVAASELEDTLNSMAKVTEPDVVITDMKADNPISGGGEVSIGDIESARSMIERLNTLSEKFVYKGKETSIGSFDIRFMVRDGDDSWIVYVAKDRLYFEDDGARYAFVPENDDVRLEYEQFYNTLAFFVRE